jgi:signal transduction histidine kinase
LKQAAFYSNKDLEDIGRNLQKYREAIELQKESNDPQIVTLLKARMDICETTLAELRALLSHMPPDMEPTYDKLVSILRSLSACNVKTKVTSHD